MPEKTLRKLPKNTVLLLRQKMEQLASDPYALNHNVRQLTGRSGYRLRIGDWRVIYEIDNHILVIHVLAIGARGGIYQ